MAEAPKRLELCHDGFDVWWQVAEDTPAERRVAFVRADIADAQHEALVGCVDAMERADRSVPMTNRLIAARAALAKGEDEG